ncbi:hypothetical protein MSATCC14277_3670 [Metamycoplasma salivarium]|uniref:hypothetical protein n=1 Tax=Metamycoplasma salivarium TaxID=2124 RepID=UPI001F2F73C4|nr:hypothetical protein [Metamycoplasma salivarium]GIZ05785.1 hypothetical protein MSATCC14277_3670 [Metamycoplasma salivarium]
MKNIKKLSKSAIILYFVELVLAFAIIGLAVSAISAIGLERYKDWKNLSEAEKTKIMPYLIGVLVCAVFILPIGLATFVLEIVVAVKGLATKKESGDNIIYILLLIGIFVLPLMALICLFIIVCKKDVPVAQNATFNNPEQQNNVNNQNNQPNY